MAASATDDIIIKWRIPTTAGNDIQGDTVEFDITFTIGAVRDWESHSDSECTVVCDYFTTPHHIVYLYGENFEPSTTYHIATYDADGNSVYWDTVTTLDNVLSVEYDFRNNPHSVPGVWHAVVYREPDSWPTTYIANDSSKVAEDSFEATASAIPEFPGVIAGIAVGGMCFGIYYLMRKRVLVDVKA